MSKITKNTQKKDFDINCDVISLTFKDAGLIKTEILNNIEEKLTYQLVGAVVAEEKYQNGLTHFHVWIKTHNKRKYTMKELDSYGGCHGHYQPVRQTPLKNLAYVIKDNNYVSTKSSNLDALIKQAIISYSYTNQKTFIEAALRNDSLPPVNYKKKDE